jgi:hypothetical protein
MVNFYNDSKFTQNSFYLWIYLKNSCKIIKTRRYIFELNQVNVTKPHNDLEIGTLWMLPSSCNKTRCTLYSNEIPSSKKNLKESIHSITYYYRENFICTKIWHPPTPRNQRHLITAQNLLKKYFDTCFNKRHRQIDK